MIEQQTKKENNSLQQIEELEKRLNDKDKELFKQIKRNEVIQNILDKMYEERNLKEGNTKVSVKNALSCKSCDFVGKNKVGLAKHEKTKHEQIKQKTTMQTIQKQDVTEGDEFTNKVNDFLKAMNYLNKSQNEFPCVNCSETFGSKEFLDIHVGATHKVKCEICEFETGHTDLMKEHIEMPGLWHKNKS